MWTRDSVKELIKVKYGITMPNRTVGEYLRRWGFTVQRPAKRAINQKPEQAERRLEEEYPAIHRKAMVQNIQELEENTSAFMDRILMSLTM